MSFIKNPVSFLRIVILIEGVSFLVLLGVAMPLKYFAGLPMAVKVAGWIHGLLFIAFCGALRATMTAAHWPLQRAVTIFVAALLPVGPFLFERRLRAYESEFQKNRAASRVP